jgi:plasmid maintenance system killer protein
MLNQIGKEKRNIKHKKEKITEEKQREIKVAHDAEDETHLFEPKGELFKHTNKQRNTVTFIKLNAFQTNSCKT